MSRIQLLGVNGSNPLGFLAAQGLLSVVPDAKLGFFDDGSFLTFVDGFNKTESALAALVAADAQASAAPSAPWRVTYTKGATKMQGPQQVADLKPPPDEFRKSKGSATSGRPR